MLAPFVLSTYFTLLIVLLYIYIHVRFFVRKSIHLFIHSTRPDKSSAVVVSVVAESARATVVRRRELVELENPVLMLCCGVDDADTVVAAGADPTVALGTVPLLAPFCAMEVADSSANPMESGLYRKTE